MTRLSNILQTVIVKLIEHKSARNWGKRGMQNGRPAWITAPKPVVGVRQWR